MDPHLKQIKDGGLLTRCLTNVWWSTTSERQRTSYRHLPKEGVSAKDSSVRLESMPPQTERPIKAYGDIVVKLRKTAQVWQLRMKTSAHLRPMHNDHSSCTPCIRCRAIARAKTMILAAHPLPIYLHSISAYCPLACHLSLSEHKCSKERNNPLNVILESCVDPDSVHPRCLNRIWVESRFATQIIAVHVNGV